MAKLRKITLDNFDREVDKILEMYGEEVGESMDAITHAIANKGKKLLWMESTLKIPHTTTYPKKWAVKAAKKRMYSKYIIYHKQPGLPHLLEYGHALMYGGRHVGDTRAFTHIRPVEDKLIEQFQREVMTKL